jgi:hypothetical protein
MEEPVVVFSHINDAHELANVRSDYYEPGDSRVMPKGLLRDQRYSEEQMEMFDFEIPSSTFI